MSDHSTPAAQSPAPQDASFDSFLGASPGFASEVLRAMEEAETRHYPHSQSGGGGGGGGGAGGGADGEDVDDFDSSQPFEPDGVMLDTDSDDELNIMHAPAQAFGLSQQLQKISSPSEDFSLQQSPQHLHRQQQQQQQQNMSAIEDVVLAEQEALDVFLREEWTVCAS